jgi:D-3-phosphoglycerate dehydrogenase
MASKKILVTDSPWAANMDMEAKVLKEIDAELVLAPSGDEPTLVTEAKGCVGILTCWAKTTAAVIDACDNCRIVSRVGIGLDNIDIPHCTKRKIPVTYVPDYCIGEVADHTMALVLAFQRKIAFFDREIRKGTYNRLAGYPIRRLEGQTLGILGFGRIGRQVALRAAGFGLETLACDPELTLSEARKLGVTKCTFVTLLKESDFITLHLPLNPKTYHIMGTGEFAMMKPAGVLINTSRGGLVDHDALLEALNSGRILGACLDVTEPEPLPAGHPLTTHERVINTPHNAFASREAVAELRQRSAKAIVDALKGAPFRNLVNPEIYG